MSIVEYLRAKLLPIITQTKMGSQPLSIKIMLMTVSSIDPVPHTITIPQTNITISEFKTLLQPKLNLGTAEMKLSMTIDNNKNLVELIDKSLKAPYTENKLDDFKVQPNNIIYVTSVYKMVQPKTNDRKQIEMTEATQKWLKSLPSPIDPIVLTGLGRAGKSDVANRIASTIHHIQTKRKNDNIHSTIRNSKVKEEWSTIKSTLVSDYKNDKIQWVAPFQTSAYANSCTYGIDAFALARLNDKNELAGCYLFIDSEGQENGPTLNHHQILAFVSRVTNNLIFMEDGQFNVQTIHSLGKLIGSRLVARSPNDTNEEKSETYDSISWPHLVIVVNKFLLELDPPEPELFLESRLADSETDTENNADRKAIREHFSGADFCTIPFSRNRNTDEEYQLALMNLAMKIIHNSSAFEVNGILVGGNEYYMVLSQLVGLLAEAKPFPPSTPLRNILTSLCDKIRDEAVAYYNKSAKEANLLPTDMDGRKLYKEKHNELADLAVAHFVQGTATIAAEFVQVAKAVLIQHLEACGEALKSASEGQLVFVDIRTETKVEKHSRDKVYSHTRERRIHIFRVDKTEVWHVYETHDTYARTIKTQKNGDKVEGDWNRVASARVHVDTTERGSVNWF